MTAPKDDLREFARSVADTLATALHAADCGCPDWSPGDDEDPRYDTAADQALIDWTYGGHIREEWGVRLTWTDGSGHTQDHWRENRDDAERMAACHGDGKSIANPTLIRRFVITTAAAEATP